MSRECYVVFHGQGEYMDEELKFIGVFSSRELAEAAVNYLKLKPGFSSSGHFHIDAYEIDKTQWSEGFITV